jgi:hypothetical protein
MKHLVEAMDKGQLIDQSCECFAVRRRVRHAITTWDMAAEVRPGSAMPGPSGTTTRKTTMNWTAKT